MLNKDLVKKVAQKIDDLIDWKKITGKAVFGMILETVDNFGFPWGLGYLNEKFADKIPVQFVDNIESIFEAFIEDDFQGVLDAMPENIDEFIDVKAFEDDFEAIWISVNFQALLKVIKYYAEKKQEAIED